jgi:hypothetical protein
MAVAGQVGASNKRETYEGAIERVFKLVAQRYPQLSRTPVKALGNYFAYDWR